MRFAPLIALLLAASAGSALAQAGPSDLNGRVTKLEKEVRAVQRKVFPGAAPGYFDAEIAPAETPVAAPGEPASSPLNDLTARVDALERTLATLTAQSEKDSYELHQLQDQLNRFKSDAEFRLNALEGKPNAPTGGGAAAPEPAPFVGLAPKPGPFPPKPEPAPTPAPTKPAVTPAPAVAADPLEAEYLAAYQFVRDAKYPDAETALKGYVTKYPKSKRASYAQYWLGRAYLADAKPNAAAEAFLNNYTTNPRGDRAPESLYWLGQTLSKLNKPTEACRVYGELLDVYGAKMSAGLKDQATKARAAANCGK
jgi:tol-pal system protein YbgF